MDPQAVLSLVAVSLITAGCKHISVIPTTARGITSLPSQPNSTPSNCTCPVLASSPTAAPTHPHLGLLKVNWTGECKGEVELFHHQHLSFSPVCHDSNVRRVLETVCREQRGCKGTPLWKEGRSVERAFNIQETGIEQVGTCESLRFQCSADVAQTDVQGQLRTYKVMTALLICVLLVLLMVRFTKPTVRALQKRLSDRRQNRWIGPTQSHSVSYHREQTAVKNNDREKRLSYPALERLTVTDSREPSSNRNSDCNY